LDPVQKISDANVDEWRALFEVNFLSTVELVARAIPELRKVHGRVVFVSSGAAVKGYVYYSSFSL
jgi:NAD(P)-dependent dehydrogenase (short-subunit alcohol dehydrogenase family)